MYKKRLWPTFTYILVCAFAWYLKISSGNQGTNSGAWIAAILLILTSLPFIFFIHLFHNILDPLHVVRPTPWAPSMTDNEIFLICELVNLLFIFLLTSNISFNRHGQP